MMTKIALAVVVAMFPLFLTPGCKKYDPYYCDDETMCKAGKPFCDVEGEYPESEGVGNTCIDWPWDASMPSDASNEPTDASVSNDASLPDAAPEPRSALIAVGNKAGKNHVYRVEQGGMPELAWSSTEEDSTMAVSFGEYDGDGYPDLAVGNYGGPDRVYRNLGDDTFELAWTSTEADNATAIAWVDYDKDGDLDLAIANGGSDGARNRVYRNDAGSFVSVWTDAQEEDSLSMSWGDFDDDGDPDVVFGNFYGKNRLHLTSGSSFILTWSSEEVEATAGVAWGDYDGDGDLDLAAANSGLFSSDPDRVYRNDSGTLLAAWASPEEEESSSVAWIDIDNDGRLDLAFGTWIGDTRIYRNDAGDFSLWWKSDDSDRTNSIAFCDFDGDGRPDLLRGNEGGNNSGAQNRAYRNTGTGLQLLWSMQEADRTASIDIVCPE